jgi:predicted AAA+ superfamily ATPase
VETQIQRDVRDLSRIHSLDALPRLLAAAASHTATLLNVADLAAPLQLTRQTIHDHVTLLERVFLLGRLPAWHTNRLSRLVKRPKLHVGDTGIACALLGLDASALSKDRPMLGTLLETFVLQDLRRQASGRDVPVGFFHFRDRDDFEVDIVLERGPASVVGVEVKAAASVNDSDFRGLRKLRDAAGKRFVSGVVLHDGAATIPFGDGLFAVPIRSLWESS